MTLKINLGLSKKVGDPNYGSHGATVNLEAEVDASLIGDPVKFKERVRSIFGMVRASLAEELNGRANDSGAPPIADRDGRNQPAANGSPPANGASPPGGNGYENNNGPRLATPSQVKAIFYIAKRFDVDLLPLLRERFGRSRVEELTLREASQLIDDLKQSPAI